MVQGAGGDAAIRTSGASTISLTAVECEGCKAIVAPQCNTNLTTADL